MKNLSKLLKTHIATQILAYLLIMATQLNSTTSALYRANGIGLQRNGMTEFRTVILGPIYIIVSFLIAAVLFPISMTQVTSAVTTSWSSAVSVSYVTLLPIIVIVSIVLHY